jgi:hypothetical protein
MLRDLEQFMELEHDANWLALAREAMTSKAHYEHPSALTTTYAEAVKRKFGKFPEIAGQLLAFVKPD